MALKPRRTTRSRGPQTGGSGSRGGRIPLTPDEEQLLAQISLDHSPGTGTTEGSRTAVAALAQSLLERGGIPAARWRYFTEPGLNLGGRRSRMEVFEENGTEGAAILGHGNFLPFLRYFIFGPALPGPVVHSFSAFVEEAAADSFFSSGDLQEAGELARSLTRQYDLDPRVAREEFYKLALECDLDASDAAWIRGRVAGLRR